MGTMQKVHKKWKHVNENILHRPRQSVLYFLLTFFLLAMFYFVRTFRQGRVNIDRV